MLSFVWVGCGDPSSSIGTDETPTDTVLSPTDPVVVSLAVPAAFDPAHAALAFTVTGPPGAPVTVTVTGPENPPPITLTLDDGGQAVGQWDGRTGGTQPGWAAPGAYTVVATSAPLDPATASTLLVRTGFLAAWLDDDDGVTGQREPLYYPASETLAEGAEPVAVLAALDDGVAPLNFPPVPDGMLQRRPLDAEPAAYRYDSRPILTLDPPEGTGLDAGDVTLTVEGWTVLSGVPVRPGVPVVLQRDEPLGDTVGVSALDLALVFSAGGAPIAEQHLPLELYRVLDASSFPRPEANYRAWQPVVDGALTAIDGTVAAPIDVVDALVEYVYYDLGLTYDTVAGASTYSYYDSYFFLDPHFLLSDFLARRFGNVINCSDAANILGAYANMVGVPLDHLILDPGFDLNYILAIGEVEFTSCPFGPYSCGFNYHAVTTIGDEHLIWDATLALDGDGDPGTLPATALLVQQITGEDYIDHLVRSGNPSYSNQARETLQ